MLTLLSDRLAQQMWNQESVMILKTGHGNLTAQRIKSCERPSHVASVKVGEILVSSED